MYRKILALVIVLVFIAPAIAFTPAQPVMSLKNVRVGMNGHMLTVLKGTEPEKLPVKILSVIPGKPFDMILIKLTGKNKLAQGMSGSPVYVNDKLIGAVRSGWENSDQTLALVIPIEAMCNHLELNNTNLLSYATVAGIKPSSLSRLSKTLGLNISQGPLSSHNLDISKDKFKPGDAVAALLVWGDVELSAVGTITATSSNGKFLAFGHEFLDRGRVNYPSARAFIHETIDSSEFPFKLATPLYINGIINQDREVGIAGQTEIFPTFIPVELKFKNLDTNKDSRYKFCVVADEFIGAKLIDGIYSALIAEAWGRKGQGTMYVNFRIDGRNIPNGWTREDIFYSDSNIIDVAFKDSVEMINSYLTQPFAQILPVGFTLTVEATQEPKILRIEDVNTVSKAKPGEEIEISVTLRGWRTETIKREFKLKIPDDASGVSELIVRGGSEEPMPQTAINEGYKTIDGLERLLTEFEAADGNNELILELNSDNLGNALNKVLSKKAHSSSDDDDLLPEEQEFLSETKSRRIEEGNLKIYTSEYFISGMMKRIIRINTEK